MPTSSPKSLNCPTCGAPLDIDGKNPVVHCKFCQNVILIDALKPGDKPEAAPENARGIPAEILAQLKSENLVEATRLYREIYDVSQIRARYAIEQILNGNLISPEAGFPVKSISTIGEVTPAQKTGMVTFFGGVSLLGCVLPVLIALGVGGVIAIALMQPGGPINPKLNPFGPSLLIPSEQDGNPDVVTQFYNVNDENRLLGRVSTLTGKLLWKSEPLPKDQSVDFLLTDNKNIYYVNDSFLNALNFQDGTQIWQIELPDNLEYGDESLVVAEDRIIAMTQNRTLQAYNSLTGELVWSRSLNGNDRNIRKMGSQVVILDTFSDGSPYSLVFIAPGDGHETLILTPVCQAENSFEDDLDLNSGIVFDEYEKSLYLIYGFFDGCVQRYNLLNGQMIWQYSQDDAFNFSMDDFQPILTDSQLIFTFDHSLYMINKKSGILDSYLEEPNHELVPLTLTGNNLVIRTRRTLGTERFELWGFNISSGARSWEMITENSSPLDPPDEYQSLLDIDDFAWTWHETQDGLMVLEFQAEPNQLVIKTINLTDGSTITEKTLPLKSVSGDFYSTPEIIGWQGNLLYFTMESRLYVLDVSTGEIVMKF